MKIILPSFFWFLSFLYVFDFSNAQYDNPSMWEVVNASNITGIVTTGYNDVVVLNSYLYYVPYNYEPQSNGKILRFKSGASSSFSDGSLWSVFNAQTIGLNISNFYGGVVVNNSIIFIPFQFGWFLKYDSLLSFTQTSSYSVFNSKSVAGPLAFGGGCFDKFQYVYFSPFLDSTFTGKLMRWDSTLSFTSTLSWKMFDLSNVNSRLVGFVGAVCLSQILLLVPYAYSANSTTVYHNIHVSFNTSADFESVSSYTWSDSASLLNYTNPVGYVNGVQIGKWIYYSPSRAQNGWASRALRYNSELHISDPLAFQFFDVSNVSNLNARGFYGLVCDERHVYYTPYFDNSTYTGKTVRFDTLMNFTDSNAWLGFDTNNTNGFRSIGYRQGAYDDRFIYFAPFATDSSTSYSGLVIRYDTQHPYPTPIPTPPTPIPTPKPTPPTPIPTPLPTPQPTPQNNGDGNITPNSSTSDSSMPIIVIIIPIVVVVVLICVILLVLFIRYRKRSRSESNEKNTELDANSENSTIAQTPNQYQSVSKVNNFEKSYENVGNVTKQTEYANVSNVGNDDVKDQYANSPKPESEKQQYANIAKVSEGQKLQQQQQYDNLPKGDDSEKQQYDNLPKTHVSNNHHYEIASQISDHSNQLHVYDNVPKSN